MLQVHQNLDISLCATSSSNQIDQTGTVKQVKLYLFAWFQRLLNISGNRFIKLGPARIGAAPEALLLAVCADSDRLRLQMYRLCLLPDMEGLNGMWLRAM